MTHRHWRWARRIAQVLSLVFFTSLVILIGSEATLRDVPPGGAMRPDPLAAIAAMIASRQWIRAFLPGLVMLGLSLAIGRAWCGWLCPLGTLIDWFSPRRRGAGADPAPPSRWRNAKYGLLFVILFMTLWGSLTLLVLDPLTLFIRGVTTLVLPGLTWLVTWVESALYRFAFLRGPLMSFDAALRGTLLSYDQPYFGGLVLTALLGGILAFGLVVRRAWCRYLCPLGGLYSLTSRASWLKRRVSDTCVSCGACAKSCPMATIDAAHGYASDSGECTLCMDCAAECPKGAIRFGGTWRIDRGHDYDPSRRQVLGTLGVSLGALALLRVQPTDLHPNVHLLRPPGVTEGEFLASCVRCGACLRACPTHGLQPSITEAGLEGLWTPVLVPRLGPCLYACTTCGEACPTGAIPPLAMEAKWSTPIGKAYVDPARCIPWSGRAECIVCEEMCPLPEKAITLAVVEARDASGVVRALQAPVVNHDRCIGCGTCEWKCPAQGEAAIRVIVDPLG